MIRCSSLRSTSRAKSGGATAATARIASWTGFPSQMPHVARGSAIRRPLWSTSTVASPASPGATILGPPLKPAKKCGSTKPVVIRRSASTQSRLSSTGTSPTIPRSTRVEPSRERWFTTRHERWTSGPSIASSSSSVLLRCVPVAMITVTSSGRTMPSSSARIASSITGRGWARVMSQTEMARRCPGRAISRSGGPAVGARRASSTVANESAAASRWRGRTTVVRLSGSVTRRPREP